MYPFLRFNIFLFVLILFSLSSGQQRKINVSGTVVDSITGVPVPDVLVLLTDNVSDVMKGDINAILSDTQSTRTDNGGKFSVQVDVDLTSFVLAGIFIKGTYQIKVQTATILLSRASFSSVKFRKEEFRTIEVSGIVKDSITDQPVSNALIILTNTTIMYDSVYHIFTSDDQGRFSQKMKMGMGGIVSPWIFYSVQKTGYDTLMNMIPDNGKNTVDLGSIFLTGMNTADKKIPLRKNALPKPKSSLVFIYSLNGRLLYSGHQVDRSLLGKRGRRSLRPLVIRDIRSNVDLKEIQLNVLK